MWLENGDSTLDLEDRHFVLLAGPAGEAWSTAGQRVGTDVVVTSQANVANGYVRPNVSNLISPAQMGTGTKPKSYLPDIDSAMQLVRESGRRLVATLRGEQDARLISGW
jgi:hypothetical protein